MEAKKQLTETSGCPVGSQLLQEAMNNICGTWQTIADLITTRDEDAPLDYEILYDPSYPVTQLMLTIYTL